MELAGFRKRVSQKGAFAAEDDAKGVRECIKGYVGDALGWEDTQRGMGNQGVGTIVR